MLTLRPLASPSDLRAESQAIPSELRYFLARSVAERPRRIQSVVEWLRELEALVTQEGWAASAQDLSAFLAEVDERLRPLKPDTTEITAADLEEAARVLRAARAEKAAAAEAGAEHAAEEAVAAEEAAAANPAEEGDAPAPAESSEVVDEERPSRGESYETSVITGEELKPLLAEGRLVKTSNVKRASGSNATPSL